MSCMQLLEHFRPEANLSNWERQIFCKGIYMYLTMVPMVEAIHLKNLEGHNQKFGCTPKNVPPNGCLRMVMETISTLFIVLLLRHEIPFP